MVLAAMEHFAKYKQITGPIVVSIGKTFDDLVRASYRYDYPGLTLPLFCHSQ